MIVLERFAYTPMGTFGRIVLAGKTLFTCEDPDNANAGQTSCIPEGAYECVPTIFHTGGYATHEIMGVPNRSRILIHKGNTNLDTRGCVLLGERLGVVGALWGITQSTAAFKFWRDTIGDQKFTLHIRFYTPTKEIRHG